MIRSRIIEMFRNAEAAPDADEVARRLGLSKEDLAAKLRSEAPLNDLSGLSPGQAKQILERFNGMAVFAPDLETTIAQFAETRSQIRDIEKQARDNDPKRGK